MTEFLISLSGVFIIALAAVMSPGPDFFLVVQSTFDKGYAAGVKTSAGIALALILHSALAVLGLAMLLEAVPTLQALLQLAGALYLIYLGFGGLRASIDAADTAPAGYLGAGSPMLRGFIGNILNPKVTIFFLAIFSTALPPAASPGEKAILIGLVPAIAFAWFAALALFFSRSKYLQRLRKPLQILSSLALLAFGLATIVMLAWSYLT